LCLSTVVKIFSILYKRSVTKKIKEKQVFIFKELLTLYYIINSQQLIHMD
jgi:hypothetical protein